MGQELHSISPHTRILLWPKKNAGFSSSKMLGFHLFFFSYGFSTCFLRDFVIHWDFVCTGFFCAPWFFSAKIPLSIDLKSRSVQGRSLESLPEIASWHEALVEIHQFGKHLAFSVGQLPNRTAHECLNLMELRSDKSRGEGGPKNVVLFFFEMWHLVFVWCIFFLNLYRLMRFLFGLIGFLGFFGLNKPGGW